MKVFELELDGLVTLLRLSSDFTSRSSFECSHTNDGLSILCGYFLDILDGSIDRVGRDVGGVVTDVDIQMFA